MRRQGSQVSMSVARGSASWLSSHGRGLGQDFSLERRMLFKFLEKDSEISLSIPISIRDIIDA